MTSEPETESLGSLSSWNREFYSQVPHLYIHIPFCRQKCHYCDFISYAGKESLGDDYVSALIRELNYWKLSVGSWNFKTVYIGGGTPTILNTKQIARILEIIPHLATQDVEITIEANPATAGYEKLRGLRDIGINRLSIGAQSFHNHHLETLGRIHKSQDIYEIYENARKAGFKNIGIDLIFALPNQNFEEWQKDIQEVLKLNPEHISTYNLQIEEGTPLFEMANCQLQMPNKLSINNFQLPDEDEEAEMYEYAIKSLKDAGYNHYEISNFAKPGFECKHNIAYWQNKNYLGIGSAAHSHLNGKRWSNPASLETYLNSPIQKTPDFSPDSTPTSQLESIFMGLRLLEGIPRNKFQGFETKVNDLMQQSLLRENGENIQLTHKGLMLANLVFEQFI